MKISAIFGLLKKSKAIITYKKDYKQWISDGAAAYDVSFLPELDAATVFAIAGIPEKAQDDFTIRENEVWNNIFDADDTDRSNETDALPLMNFQCIFRGTEVRPFVCGGTVYLFDNKYFKPFADMKGSDSLMYSLCLDPSNKDRAMLLVRYGMILTAVIMPFKICKEAYGELSMTASSLESSLVKDE